LRESDSRNKVAHHAVPEFRTRERVVHALMMKYDRHEAGSGDDEEPAEHKNRRLPQAGWRQVSVAGEYTCCAKYDQAHSPAKLGKGSAIEPWALPGSGLSRDEGEDARERGRHSVAHVRVIFRHNFSLGGAQCEIAVNSFVQGRSGAKPALALVVKEKWLPTLDLQNSIWLA
jgi:hypothetical protein